MMIVTMIIQIAYTIRFFLLVLFIVLAGFTQAFWLLSNVDNGLLFGNVKSAFLTSFMYMLGQNIDTDFTGTVSPKLSTFLLIVFMLTMIILNLNLLIALMGDVFSRVRAKGQAVWRKEQASIIIEESFLIQHHQLPPYLHILKYASDVANEARKKKQKLLYILVKQSRLNVQPFTSLSPEDDMNDVDDNIDDDDEETTL
jgi:hypothetical protein